MAAVHGQTGPAAAEAFIALMAVHSRQCRVQILTIGMWLLPDPELIVEATLPSIIRFHEMVKVNE